ncbi:hypothetical protein ANN_01014 [Periplaneta americana]|uniref:Uncharacterized protein n=1 Tax=Periplaneta americana TaxID=6978 RepID=A0ABQ8TUT8_PERAM|nr:hypothetical protein ANN_01014 [Periplaneta americana]
MAGLCEGGNEPPGSLKARVLLDVNKSTDMSLSHLITLKCHRPRLENLLQNERIITLDGSYDNDQQCIECSGDSPVRQEKKNVVLFNNTHNCRGYISVTSVPEFCLAGVHLHASKSTDMSLSHLSTLICHQPGPGSNPQPREQKARVIPTAPPRQTQEKKVAARVNMNFHLPKRAKCQCRDIQ